MNPLTFFTPVTYGKQPKSIGIHLLENVDAYFYLGGRKALVIPGNIKSRAEGVKLVASKSSSINTALKVASYCLIVIPLIMLISKMILRTIYKFYIIHSEKPILPPNILPKADSASLDLTTLKKTKVSQAKSQEPLVSPKQIIESFWNKHIASFKICHGTTSLFLKHFKEYGISPTYPPALDNIITRIRNVWKNHEHDICPRTDYFKNFEERFDDARLKQKVNVSFTADPFRQYEYTKGARGWGGEWIRELRTFIDVAKRTNNLLSPEEKLTVEEMQSLIEVMQDAPPMKIKVPYHIIYQYGLLGSLQSFEEEVRNECPEWQNPQKLSMYLDTIVLPKLNEVKRREEGEYEHTVTKPIRPEHLEFEMVDHVSHSDYPKLDFDDPQELSSEQTGKLRIRMDTSRSELEEYQDSIFNSEWTGQAFIVTRKKRPLTEEEEKSVELTKKKLAMRKLWLQKFI